jgi:hypothetical protein
MLNSRSSRASCPAASGRSAAVLLAEQHRELVPGQTPRRRGQEQEDLTVTGAEADRLPPAAAIVDGEQGVRPTESLQDDEHTPGRALSFHEVARPSRREKCCSTSELGAISRDHPVTCDVIG